MRSKNIKNNLLVETKSPKISVVIPSFNQSQYIEETILSIIKQDYKNFELIIIDGGSSDGTVNVLNKYNSQINYWISEPDNGQADAINKGFAKSTGDIVGWINSDDYYLPGYFSKVAQAFKNDRKLDFIYANSITYDERDKKIYLEYGKYLTDSFLVFGSIIFSHTAFWRKKIHQALDEKINCAVDYELWMRLLKNKKYMHLNYFGGVFRLHLESKSMLAEKTYKIKWNKDFEYIEKKHKLKNKNIWIYRLFKYLNLLYHFKCSFKFNHLKENNFREMLNWVRPT